MALYQFPLEVGKVVQQLILMIWKNFTAGGVSRRSTDCKQGRETTCFYCSRWGTRRSSQKSAAFGIVDEII